MAQVGRKKGQKKSFAKTVLDSYDRYIRHINKRIERGLATPSNVMSKKEYIQFFHANNIYKVSNNDKYRIEKIAAKETSAFRTVSERNTFMNAAKKYIKKNDNKIEIRTIVDRKNGKPIYEMTTWTISTDLNELNELGYTHGQLRHIEYAIRIANGEKREAIDAEYGY